ncbi:MAG: ACP S-malonyltransferase [Fretibacterium sp.]|nr:ACP S-malonyltransferase [Fretibacterium sp.]
MKYALCFPGQGAQQVGMGRELFDAFPSAKSVFEEADDALSSHLTELIFNGPEGELTLTANAQPAIMTVSIAALRALQDDMGVPLAPAFTAGHSLGEYTALVAAGTLSFRDAVRLVNKRGQWMQEATPEGVGAMAAILGLGADDIRAICAEAAPNGECQAANFNSPGQVVISGVAEFVDKASTLAKTKGARKAVRLNVSAPFHSRLMIPAAEKLKSEFEKCEWADPKWPVVANVSAKPVTAADAIRASLYEQTFSPVLWEDSVVYMADNGVDTFLELGPGEVLCGLIKRCRKGLTQKAAGIPDTLETLAKLLRGEA